MFYDLSTPEPVLLDEIATLVGQPHATRSPYVILSASTEIFGMLDNNRGLPPAQVELRENGMLVHFQSQGKGMVWAIPYWRLHIQHNGGKLSLFSGEHHMRLEGADGNSVNRESVANLYERMASATGQDNDYYGAMPW